MIATGKFEVEAAFEPPFDEVDQVALARASFDKSFHGALEAKSQVQMLAARTPIEGSAGYVAIERIVGTLDGRSGSFVVVHTGLMTRGDRSLSIQIVADSGTGGLSGIRGSMDIQITDGQHFYSLDYTFPSDS